MHVAALAMVLSVEPGSAEARVSEVFEEYCTLCHDSSDDLNLEVEPSKLIGRKSNEVDQPIVKAGDPNASYLFLKVYGAEGIEGDPMPLGEDPIPDEDQEAIRTWIAGLAPAGGEVPPSGDDADPEPGEGEGEGEDASAGEGEGELEALPPQKQRGRKPFHGTHQINLNTTTTLGKRNLEFRVHHRFGKWGTPFREPTYFGLAGGVVMSLGVAYGIVDGLDVLARWTNSRLGHELGITYVPIRQEDGMPVSFGGYGSFELFVGPKAEIGNKYTGNFQLMLSRLWFDRWSTQLLLNYSMFTNHDPNPIATRSDGTQVFIDDDRGTFNLGIASTVWLGKKKKHGIDLEYQLPIPDGREPYNTFYYNGGDARPNGTKIGSWAVGWSVRAGLHFFQVFFSNTQNIHTNLVAPGGDTENPFDPLGDFHLGFNISRKWKL